MNFLKKKLKGHNNKHDDDDDDYDHYPIHVPPLNASEGQNGAELVNSEHLLQQLKQKESERRESERLKREQLESTKQDQEDWRYFLSLTQKVQDTVAKTQKNLQILKEQSTVEKIIIAKEDEEEAAEPKSAGNWIPFDENVKCDVISDYCDEPIDEDDPFDTSFVDVSRVANSAAVEVIVQPIADPFDTSHIESAGISISEVKPSSIDISPIEVCGSKLSRASSRDSIMSNPFLTDDFYTPYASGATTPFSGTATPKRRNSTNPFEQSPEEEAAPFGVSPVASAIADMTADFYSAISETKPFDPFATIHDDETPKRQSLTEAVVPEEFDATNGHTVDSDEDDHRPSSERRRSSAFQMELLERDDPAPTFEPLPESLVANRKPPREESNDLVAYHDDQYFDPFQTVHEDIASPPDEDSGKLQNQDSVNDEGHPNRDATGIVNDAFDDTMIDDERQTDDDIVESDTNAIEDSATDVSVTTILGVTSGDSGVVGSSAAAMDIELDITECTKDPFDTSEFDSSAFDAFATKFESSAPVESAADPFASPLKLASQHHEQGFDIFDPFARNNLRTPKNTPAKLQTDTSKDSFDDDDTENIRVVIRAKMKSDTDIIPSLIAPPLLPPPPKSPKPALENLSLMPDDDATTVDEFEDFFGTGKLSEAAQSVMPAGGDDEWPCAFGDAATKRTDSVESPQTPLFDEDTSQPLEDFPAPYTGNGWDMMLRYPNKKKLTANRCWKKIFVRFVPDNCVLQLFNKREDNDPFQELPLQPTYSMSDISAQQYDQYGKIFTIKLQYIFYRERVGVRPGQIARVVQGQIMSMGQIAKLGVPLEHAPQISELLKLGSQTYTDLRVMQTVMEEALFRMTIHRDRALQYKTEEIQCSVRDELYVEQNRMGSVTKQLARVRIFFLAFINGMPSVEVGINDLKRQGKEVVGRHDIIPVVTEEWIRLEACEFHCVVQRDEFESTRIIKLIPPDAVHIELMRFRIRPPRNRELPLQVSANMNITKSKVEIKCEVLVPGCISRKHGQIPCEDIVIRFHIPECWIYFFRVEKHFRYGALKSASRRHGKIKGIERILGGGTPNNEPQLIEVSAGQAKYEHAFHSIVWRIPRLPKEGQGAYTQQLLMVRLPMTSFDQIPESFYEYVHVEFKMPSTTVSHTTLRSISVSNENPPEKFVRYLAKYDYRCEMSITHDENPKKIEYAVPIEAREAREARDENANKDNAEDDEEESDEND